MPEAGTERWERGTLWAACNTLSRGKALQVQDLGSEEWNAPRLPARLRFYAQKIRMFVVLKQKYEFARAVTRYLLRGSLVLQSTSGMCSLCFFLCHSL